MAYLILDLGTSAMKAFVLSEDGEIISSSRQKWPEIRDEELVGVIEYDPKLCEERLFSIIKEAVSASRSKITAVTVSAQRIAMAFLDREGETVYIGPNSDARGLYLEELPDEDTELELHKRTGHIPFFLFAPARLKWLEENEPERRRRVRWIATLHDWAVFKLTGELVSEPAVASDIGMVDLRKRSWCEEPAIVAGLEDIDSMLPEMRRAGEYVAEVRKEIGRKLGLEGAEVYVGSGDTYLGVLASGGLSENHLGIVAGFTAPSALIIGSPKVDERGRMWTEPFIFDGVWLLESNAGIAGGVIDWFTEGFVGDYGELERLASLSPIGANETYFVGAPTIMDFKNLTEQFKRVVIETSSPIVPGKRFRLADLARAVLEAVAYAIRGNVEQIEEVSGTKPRGTGVTGGLTRFSMFPKMLADVLGTDVLVTREPNGSVVGAYALLVADGRKEIGDVVEGFLEPVEHSKDASAEYTYHFSNWMEIYKRMRGEQG